MHSLLDDSGSICISQECQELETAYDLKFTDAILSNVDSMQLQVIKEVYQADKSLSVQGGSWPALWDTVRHLSSHHYTIGLQHLSRMVAHHCKGSKPCPLCNVQLSDGSLTAHVLGLHKEDLRLPHLTMESLLSLLVERNVPFAYKLDIFLTTSDY